MSYLPNDSRLLARGCSPKAAALDVCIHSPLQLLRRASLSNCPVHARKLNSSHREAQTNAKMLDAVSASAFFPE
jgi:hypothetical protein